MRGNSRTERIAATIDVSLRDMIPAPKAIVGRGNSCHTEYTPADGDAGEGRLDVPTQESGHGCEDGEGQDAGWGVCNLLDPELALERERVKALLRRNSQTCDAGERSLLLKRLLGAVGHGAVIEPPFYCTYGKNTHLGDHVYLNFSCVILDNNAVRIGRHVMIGPAVQIYTAAHPVEAETRIRGLEVAKPITIEDEVWIGGGAILLPGVTVGRGAVVGAGAVVARDVPPDAVVVGNPARVIRKIRQE